MIYKSYIVEKNINNLKNKVVLFYGENLGLKNDFKKTLKSNNKQANFNSFNQEEILKNKNNFFEDFLNISLFNDEKIYTIEQTNDKILDIILELENKIDNQKIYLFADVLDKKSKLRSYFEKSNNFGIIACYNDNEISLRKIIQENLQSFEGLSSDNINTIITNANLDRIKLNNELDKIKLYFLDKKITKSELNQLLNLNVNEDFNNLKDAAINGDLNKTNKLLSDTIIENDLSIFYLNLFNQRLNKLNDIFLSNNKNLEIAVESIKPPIFWKDKPIIKQQAKKWNLKKIKLALEKTFNFEINLKSNANLNKDLLIRKLILDVCNYANA